MDENIVEQFQKKHEPLAGIVHRVSDLAAAADAVFSILQDKQVEKVALGDLPADFGPILEQKISEGGQQMLKPPFDNAELPQAFDSIQVGVSWSAFAIAETGAIVEFATDDAMRLVTALPLVHICLVRAADFVATLKEAAGPIRDFYTENPSNATVSFISGPSRTADIEMRLILGVHGPAETHVVIVD